MAAIAKAKKRRFVAPVWSYSIPPDMTGTIQANTKSEARADLKASLGVRRLPVGSKLAKVSAI